MLRATSNLSDKGKISFASLYFYFVLIDRNQIMACSKIFAELFEHFCCFERNFFVNIHRVNWIKIHLSKLIKNSIRNRIEWFLASSFSHDLFLEEKSLMIELNLVHCSMSSILIMIIQLILVNFFFLLRLEIKQEV